MNASSFPTFYEAVNGYSPFPWQQRLAEAACAGDWPDVSLPTAAGKTSAIDIAIFSLAAQADRPPGERTARLRTAFVVDRRVVADEAYEHAKAIQTALTSSAEPVVREVAARLRALGGVKEPLAVVLLRGGVPRDETWAAAPSQPTVIVSTVDQIGSRLLFRGYGVSQKSRSIHAGLLGVDTRILLDEAHLSEPFQATVDHVKHVQETASAGRELPPCLALTCMTATPRQGQVALCLEGDDRANPLLGRRLSASKPAVTRITSDLVADAISQAVEWAGQGLVVGVVVNRVASAQAIFEGVVGKIPATLLVTGRMRPAERDAGLDTFRARIAAKASRPSTSCVVVATQSIEVGANLDFDRLITEVAPLDALKQRFGRLNRLGNHTEPCPSLVLARKEDVTGQRAGKDPVYGEVLPRVWAWLGQGVDFGVDALAASLVGVDTAPLTSEPDTCPVVLATHLDAWVQTAPTPDPDPPVAPYLHGPSAFDAADVQIVWRADLPADRPQLWAEVVAAVTPRVSEALPLPRRAAIRWLEGREPGPVADVHHGGEEERGAPGTPKGPVLRWNGQDQSILLWPEQLREGVRDGDTLIVPASYGGLDRRSHGWSPSATDEVRDIADTPEIRRIHPAFLQAERRRLYPELADLDAETLDRLYAELREEDPERGRSEITVDILALYRLTGGRVTPYCPAVDPKLGERPLYLLWSERDSFDEEQGSALSKKVGLVTHSRDVERWAGRFVDHLHPSPALSELVRKAAWLHDVGKADPRMQAWLGEGDATLSLAKSEIGWRERRRDHAAHAASGYPDGARHELQSAAMILANPAVYMSVSDPDLLVHLVGTHHGLGRGLAPVVFDPHPVRFEHDHDGLVLAADSDHGLARLDSGWAERFWMLNERYGPWGLAWLEALVRLADHRASEEEQRNGP